MLRGNIWKVIILSIVSITVITSILSIAILVFGRNETGELVDDPEEEERYLREFQTSEIGKYSCRYVSVYNMKDLKPGYIDIDYSGASYKEPDDYLSYIEYDTYYVIKDSRDYNVSEGWIEGKGLDIDLNPFHHQYTIRIDKRDDYRFVVISEALPYEYDLELTYRFLLYDSSIIYTFCILPIILMISFIIGLIYLIIKLKKTRQT